MFYELWLATDLGVRIKPITRFHELMASKADGDRAPFFLEADPYLYLSEMKKDRQIQVWRGPTPTALQLFNTYFIRWWSDTWSNEARRLQVRGWDRMDLLRRHTVAFPEGSEEAKKTAYADDLMKALVTENYGAGTGRDLSTHLTVTGDVSAGPEVTWQMAWRPVLDALQDIQQGSKGEGTEVFFTLNPVITRYGIDYIFETCTGQPGADLSRGKKRVVFDQERGNLKNPVLEYDYNDEVTTVYAMGQGEQSDVEQAVVTDDVREAESYWSRVEVQEDARNEFDAGGVEAAGNARLEAGRPVIRFRGNPQDTDGCTFGIHWNFGDRVVARYAGLEYAAIIRHVTLTVTPDGEQVEPTLDYEGPIDG